MCDHFYRLRKRSIEYMETFWAYVIQRISPGVVCNIINSTYSQSYYCQGIVEKNIFETREIFDTVNVYILNAGPKKNLNWIFVIFFSQCSVFEIFKHLQLFVFSEGKYVH